jgi:hypothetical protein
MPQSSEYIRPRVSIFPGSLRSLLQLLDAHLCRLKYDVLSVVQLPILGKNPSLGLQLFIQPRAWKRGNDSEPWEIDTAIDGKLGCFHEYIRLIIVESENEAALERYFPGVELPYDSGIILGIIEGFVRVLEGSL